jgi:hypothetical protein
MPIVDAPETGRGDKGISDIRNKGHAGVYAHRLKCSAGQGFCGEAVFAFCALSITAPSAWVSRWTAATQRMPSFEPLPDRQIVGRSPRSLPSAGVSRHGLRQVIPAHRAGVSPPRLLWLPRSAGRPQKAVRFLAQWPTNSH